MVLFFYLHIVFFAFQGVVLFLHCDAACAVSAK